MVERINTVVRIETRVPRFVVLDSTSAVVSSSSTFSLSDGSTATVDGVDGAKVRRACRLHGNVRLQVRLLILFWFRRYRLDRNNRFQEASDLCVVFRTCLLLVQVLSVDIFRKTVAATSNAGSKSVLAQPIYCVVS